MGDISPPTTADYAMAAADRSRDEIANLRTAVGVLVMLLTANRTITKEQGAEIARLVGKR